MKSKGQPNYGLFRSRGCRQSAGRSRAKIPIHYWVLVVCGVLCAVLVMQALPAAAVSSSCALVVLANPDDPYFSLAQEIAAVENAPLALNLSEALACRPVYLLWVVSPAFLSDAVMIEFGQTMRDNGLVVSSGIITGSTLDSARELWQRRPQTLKGSVFSANAPNPAAHIYEGQLVEYADLPASQALTKVNLVQALETASYLTFTGHGGSGYLRLDDDTKVTAADLLALNGTVVATGSCQTVRPWEMGSIALGFVERGAVAYTGFVYSPNEGYLIGEFDGLPFRYTWPDFPIGHALQVQTRGAQQGFAAFPYHVLLGDPRIALQSGPPYQLTGDRSEGSQRILTFTQAPAGVIPIKIVGGAAYQFVEVQGITAAAQSDPFYNSRLQMVDIRGDKYLLLENPGGELTLRLRRRAPWYWFLVDILLDAFDHTYIFSLQSGGDILALGFAILPLLWAAWQGFKKRLAWPSLALALALGAGAAALQTTYVLARLDAVTIISKEVIFSPLGVAATFTLTACSALLFFQARLIWGRLLALLVFTFISALAALGGLLTLWGINQFGFIPSVGVPLYNYSLGLLPLAAFSVVFPLAGLVLGKLKRSILP